MSFLDLVSLISFLIVVIGGVVIAWGVLLVVIAFLYGEFLSLLKREVKTDKNQLRVRLGLYILLGLEFMVSGDIIHTVIKPSKNSLIVLGSIVAIRTVISYFLHQELKGSAKS